MPHVMILLPTYNERENIRRIVPLIFSILPEVKIMVVDDHSPDGTAEEVRTLMETYKGLLLFERPGKEGLGRAYTDAFKKVLTEFPDVEIICTMDADLSHDEQALPHMIERAKKNGLVVGSRYIRGGRLVGWEWHRKLLSACGNTYVRLVTKMPVHDCTSGFNCIRTDALRRINFSDLDPSGYAFLIYLKYKMWKQGTRITEYPITFKSRATGESKISMNIIEEGILLPWRLIRKKKPETPCPLCQKSSAYWFTKNGCDVYRCSVCHLIFLSPLPSDSVSLYGQDYFCGAHNGFGYIHYDGDKEADTKSFAQYLDRIEKEKPNKGRLLDVGAATGAFIAAANRRGWDVAGVEISDYAAAEARNKGFDVRTGVLESASFPDGSFDVITLWDVFEHVMDPRETLTRIRALLKPNGLLVVNTPNAGSLYARSMGRHWPLIIPPEHTYLFREANLRPLLEKEGFAWVEKTFVGKSYTPAYIFQILSTVHKNAFWKKLSDWVKKTPFNRLSIPIHLRDNMFVVAKKKL